MDSPSPKLLSRERTKKPRKRTFIRSLKSNSEKCQITLSSFFIFEVIKNIRSERREHETVLSGQKCNIKVFSLIFF